MEAEILVTAVETAQTRSGNTRYVVRDDDGNEYSTFRPQIGEEAGRFEGRRARIEYHEEQRGNFRNVYLDAIAPAPEAVRHVLVLLECHRHPGRLERPRVGDSLVAQHVVAGHGDERRRQAG